MLVEKSKEPDAFDWVDSLAITSATYRRVVLPQGTASLTQKHLI